jgi:hypothetical protein
MGHKMKALTFLAFAGCSVLAVPCAAQERTSAITIDSWASTDADNTDVLKTGANLDWVNVGADRYQGIRLEKAWFRPLGGSTKSFERIYGRYADKSDDWAWNAQVGTDGNTVIGSVNVVGAGWRKEFFIERDIVETPIGVTRGIYYTFGGAALDVPISRRDSATVVAGAQEFTGKNVRLHLRGNYVHVLKENWGLSAQLRGRYFHSTRPGESDYFSPRWYAQILPVLQIRRFHRGWRYLAAMGYGTQRDSSSKWRPSRYLDLQLATPPAGQLQLAAGILYSNTPVSTGYVYDYLQGSLALTSRF